MTGLRDPGTARSRGLRARLRRLPLRVRLVVGFTAVMAVLLLATGVFIYWRVQYALDRRLDGDLVAEADQLTPLVQPDGTLSTDRVAAALPGVSDHQVLDAAGHVLSAGAGLGQEPLLDADTAARALRGPVHADIGLLIPVSRRPLRLLAQPVATPGPAAVLVVGLRRDERDEALRELLGQLALAGLGALAVSAVVGERLAKAALAPVERYRGQARTIAAGAPGVRLEVPDDRDDEVTRLGHTLNDMLDGLERSLARERRFLDDASHELRTPLTLLSTRVQLALRRRRSAEEYEATLRELQADVGGLATLAEQLLQIGAAEDEARRPGQRAVGDLARVVRDLPVPDERAPGSLLPAGWTVQDCTTGPVPVAVPESLARQVLLNLLSNAGVHGRPPVLVTLREVDDGGGSVAVLAVGDAGEGIPAEFLPAAADRFSRTDTARDRPGAGLGLSLVQALVERYDGELRLCSRGRHHRYEHRFDVACEHAGDGTTASVLLPVLR